MSAQLLREIAPAFERSDVNAQLLRVRLIAHHLGMVPLDEQAAREEASRAASFQALDAADIRAARRLLVWAKGSADAAVLESRVDGVLPAGARAVGRSSVGALEL